MSFPIVVIHSMSEHEVVVDDLWVLEGHRLHRRTFFPITLCLLPVVTVVGPICGHQRHDIIQFFHGVDMKGDIVECPAHESASPTFLFSKWALMVSPLIYLGQYRRFLIKALANTAFFLSSMMPLRTQNPLSRITMKPLW